MREMLRALALVHVQALADSAAGVAAGELLYAEPGMRAEGLAYHPRTGQLFFTDGNCPTEPPHDAVKAWAETGTTTVRSPSGHANGQLVLGGALLTAETTGRRITWSKVGHSGVHTLVDRVAGTRLNSPNDMAFRSADSSLWFSDPSYGCSQFGLECELAASNSLYRLDLTNDGTPLDRAGRIERVDQQFTRPNGLAFSPDEQTLYVVDSGAILSTPAGFDLARPHNVTAFDVVGAKLANPRLFAVIPPGTATGIPDGLKVDAAGRVYVAMGDGLMVFAASGELEQHVVVGSQCSNLALGDGRIYLGCGEQLFAHAAPVVPVVGATVDGPAGSFWDAASAADPAELLEVSGLPTDDLNDRLRHGMATTALLFAFGTALRAAGFVDKEHAQGVCRILVYATVPSLLLTTFWTADLSLGVWFTGVTSAILMFALLCGLAPACLLFRNADPELKGVLLVLSMGWNIGMVGFPVVKLLFGDADMPYIALFDVPNVCINFALSYVVASAYAPDNGGYVLLGHPKQNRVCQVCLSGRTRDLIVNKIARFPPLISAFLGLALSALGPAPAEIPVLFNVLKQVGDCTTPLALLCMGLLTDTSVLRLDRLRQLRTIILLRTLPVLCVLAAVANYDKAALETPGFRSIMLGLLMPAPLIAIPYANEFGYDASFASSAVVVSTLWSFVLIGLYTTGLSLL